MLYQYKCENCGKYFEVRKSMKLYNRTETCPFCDSHKTKKIPGIAPIVIKGHGTYTVSYPNHWNKKEKE